MKLTIEQALQHGIDAHKQGKLQDAEQLYQAILQSQPTHADASHNLGLIAVSLNKVALALPLFETALEAFPEIEKFWLSYIDAPIKENQLETAESILAEGRNEGFLGKEFDDLEFQIKQLTELTPAVKH